MSRSSPRKRQLLASVPIAVLVVVALVLHAWIVGISLLVVTAVLVYLYKPASEQS